MIYTAKTDFQGEVNPGPVWSYGYSPAGGSAYSFVPFNGHPANLADVDPKNIWIDTKYNELSTPTLWLNLTSQAKDGVQPGQLSLHPGPRPNGDFAILRFLAPKSMGGRTSRKAYKVTGRFFAGDAGTTSALIIKNADFANPLRTFSSTTDSPDFSLIEVMSSGDRLDFVVGNNGSFRFGNTPIDVSIECNDNDTIVDDDDLGASPIDLVPASGQYPVERAQFEVLILDEADASELKDLGSAGPLDILKVEDNTATKPIMGALLTWTQSWYTQGLALGQLLHSLALAPGESTRIAMVDWSRRQSSGATESISEGEQLFNDLARARSISEVTSAVAIEAQEGFSHTINKVETGQLGFGTGSAMTGSYENYKFAGGSGIAAGYAQGTSDVQTRSWTSGRRDVSASLAQQIVDRTHQASALTRSRWATIVKEVSQSESEKISTRAVTNFNHMHAMTVQYWETVQLYRCVVELSNIDAALFVPMKPITFDISVVKRFRREIADSGLNAGIRALKDAEPGWLAITSSSPRLVNNSWWVQAHLDEWTKVLGYPFADSTERTIVLPQGIDTDFDVAWRDEGVPISSVVVYFRDGTKVSSNVVDRAEAQGPRGLRFGTANLSDVFRRSSGGRDISSISRIGLVKSSDASMLVQITLEISSTLADAIDMPSMALGANVHIPGGPGEFTAFEFAAPFDMQRIVNHLNANRDHYSRAIWSRLSSTMVFGLLSPYSWGVAGARSLASQVDPLPIATAGNYLVFRLHPVSTDAEAEAWKTFLQSRDIRLGERKETVVPMPTGGVFAEAVLGRANSAEKIDLTRFWNWQDSPIPIVAPEISALQSGTRATAEDPKPGSTPAPVLNIMNAPAMPDPTGMAAVLSAVQNGNMFRDMSGLVAAIGAVQAGLARGFDASTASEAQAAENFKTAANLLSGVAAQGAKPGVDSDVTRTTGNLPATPTNLGGLVELGKDLDRRESAGTTEPTSGPQTGEIPVQTTQPPAPKASNERAMLYGTRPASAKSASSTPPERVLQFFVTLENSNIVVPGIFQFEVSEPFSGNGKSFAFELRSGTQIGKTIVTLPDGTWNLGGIITIRVPEQAVNIPVSVLPGLDPINFAAQRSQLNDGKQFELSHHFLVDKATRVINLHLHPELETKSATREIVLSAEAETTVAQSAEIKAEVEAKGGVGVAEVSQSGSVAIGANYSLTGKLGASQKLELKMDFLVLKSIRFAKDS